MFKKRLKFPPEPSTGTCLGKVADCGLEDFQHAIESANRAQPSYFASTTAATRGALLRGWYDLIIMHKDDRMCLFSNESVHLLDTIRQLTPKLNSCHNTLP
jgi:acyl-CoA reductase-like NAD-dependent aldehyde dehydrogenase